MKRHYCVKCGRKRLEKFMYLLSLPFIFKYVFVCNDCFIKHTHHIKILKSASVDNLIIKEGSLVFPNPHTRSKQ